MKPIKTARYNGVYGAPIGQADKIGGLPYYREHNMELGVNRIYSVWTFDEGEREAIAKGYNILVFQVGEPIRPMGVQITHLEEVGSEFNRPPKPPKPSPNREMG